MSEAESPTIPKWYWIGAVVALLFNLMGCFVLYSELFLQETLIKDWPEDAQQWARDTPAWIYFVFGIADITGVAGSIFLLMRKHWAIPAFGICLIAVIIQMGFTMVINGGLQVLGPSGAVMPCVVIILTIGFLWLSFFAKDKKWFDSPASE